MYGSFAVVCALFPTLAFVAGSGARWWLAVLFPIAALLAYSALRLATLRVILAPDGIREPAPLRPTVLTPWEDVVRVRRTERPGAMGLSFLGVSVEHQGGWKHQIIALNITTRDPLAEKTIDEWLAAIRSARRDALGPGA